MGNLVSLKDHCDLFSVCEVNITSHLISETPCGPYQKQQPTPVLLPGKSHEAWRATLHGAAKDLDMAERLSTRKPSQEWLSVQEQEIHGRLAGVVGS